MSQKKFEEKFSQFVNSKDLVYEPNIYKQICDHLKIKLIRNFIFRGGNEFLINFITLCKINNITPIDCLNKKLDPNLHQAMMEIEDNQKEPGTIIQEIQKGFMIKDRFMYSRYSSRLIISRNSISSRIILSKNN